MSKAVSGAVEIAAGAALMASGIGAGFGASLVMMGAGQELSAIVNALKPPPGIANTIRQSAAPRQIIYGNMRVGAVECYESTTGSSLSQYNMILVFSGHTITNYVNLFLDGRQVFWAGMSVEGATNRNGIIFGGGGDGQQHTGPTGQRYVFNNAVSGHSGVYVSCRFGDQAAGDFMEELNANDGSWGPDGSGNVPTLTGCAYIYLKCEYDPNTFVQKPDVKVDILGKAVFDPRTGQTTYSNNWALVLADLITNSDYGLGDQVNQEQLIAAANLCDEQVAFAGAGGGVEARYTCNYAYTTDKPVGDVMNEMLKAAEGRVSYIGGEWFIYPAAYVGPSANFDETHLIDKPTWSAKRPYRDKFNLVRGTYVAPNYPYSVAGDLYSSPNGYDFNGDTYNVFPFEFQPTDYPSYACDTLHGYAADQYAEEDGRELVETLDLAACTSITQAQRVAKIHLLRNRQQGSGTLTFGPEGLLLQPNDTFTMSFARRGWVEKLLEVSSVHYEVTNSPEGPMLRVVVEVKETDPSVYIWNASDELSPYAVPVAPDNGYYTTAPPTNMELVSSAATAVLQADGTVIPRIQVTWNTPADVRVTGIQVQYQLVGASSWTDGGIVSVNSNTAYIAPVIAGSSYNVRIASLRSNGAQSAWVELDGFQASLVLSVRTEAGIGIGSLTGEAYTDGTAAIDVNPFTAQIGSLQLAILPAGPYQITGLQQQTFYWVYYVDPNTTGGAITPIATTNISDFAGKIGYWLIDSIVTPYAATSSGGSGSGAAGKRYYPSTYQDVGYRSTMTPTAAYDGDLTTYALVSGNTGSTTTSYGDCIFQGDPSTTLTTASTLTVVAAISVLYAGGTALITASYVQNGTTTNTTLVSATATVAQQSYTLSIPAGVALNTVTVEVTATPAIIDSATGSPESGGTITRGGSWESARVNVSIYEVYVQA